MLNAPVQIAASSLDALRAAAAAAASACGSVANIRMFHHALPPLAFHSQGLRQLAAPSPTHVEESRFHVSAKAPAACVVGAALSGLP